MLDLFASGTPGHSAAIAPWSNLEVNLPEGEGGPWMEVQGEVLQEPKQE